MPALSTALGFLLVLVLPAVALYRRSQLDSTVDWPYLRRGLALQWAVTLAGTRHRDVGRRSRSVDRAAVMDAMVAFILVGVFGIGATLGARLYRSVPVDAVARTLGGLSGPRKLVVAVTAAVAEELVLRGYLVTQLEALGVGTVVAAVAAVGVGVLSHAARRSTARLVLGIPLQTAFVLAFVVTGNVVACIVAHAFYDAIALLSARRTGRAS